MDGLTIKPTEGALRTVPDAAWRIQGVADLDGDGKADIVWRHFVTGSNYLYPMNGTTIKSTEGYLRAVADLTWQIAALGDYDGDGKADILWRNGQDPQTSREYVYLGDIPVAVIADGASPSYIHADHLNTPRLIANQQGQTVWRWDQDEPFGVNVPNENPSGLGAFEFPLRFPGQYADKETGLAYNMARDYASETGRYVQSDPIGLRGGLNTYAYVDGSPLRSIDPRGLESLWEQYFKECEFGFSPPNSGTCYYMCPNGLLRCTKREFTNCGWANCQLRVKRIFTIECPEGPDIPWA